MEYYVGFWNVENLFDVVNSPRRSEKLERTLRGELGGWTEARLARKIRQLGSIIQEMNGGRGPDLLGVCEVENDSVLHRLTAACGSLGRNYQVAHHDMSDHRGIDVAFIYDADLFTAELTFSHYVVKRTATRDLFQVNFRTAPGHLLVVIGNHWPSRMGGKYETEPYRIMAGETLAYFHERIRQIHGADVAVLAMGDFNDEPSDRALVNYALSNHMRAKVTRARSPKFLNLTWPTMGSGLGTHYHENTAAVLDQVLVSKGLLTGNSGLHALTDSVEIVRVPEMIASGTYPCPVRFGRGAATNPDGYSDHFPIAVRLRE
jgi:hypothetical protein